MRPIVWLAILAAGASCIVSADKPPPPPPKGALAYPRPPPHSRYSKQQVPRSHTKQTGRKPPRRHRIPRQRFHLSPPPQLAAALRRDFAAATPAAQVVPEIVIKQAGPSKQFGWIGHGKLAAKLPSNVMSLANLPSWIPVGNSLFEAGLMYPGKPGSGGAKEPYSAPASSITYNSPPKPAYKAPVEVKEQKDEEQRPSRKAVPALNGNELSKGQKVGVYSPGNPFIKNFKKAVPAKVAGVYSPQNPLAAPPPPRAPVAAATTAATSPPTPTTRVTTTTTATPTTTTVYTTTPPPPPPPRPTTTTTVRPRTTSAPARRPVYFRPQYRPQPQPNVFTAFERPLPIISPLPPSLSRPRGKPSQQPQSVLNIPVNVEEAPVANANGDDEGEVFYVFYEDDKKPSASAPSNQYKSPLLQNSVPAYVEEKPSEAATQGLFNPPDEEDIRTIYVPFENAVNVPSTFDVNVASSFGQTPPALAPGQFQFSNYPGSPQKESPTYDNPISSYDAPIYNDGSYTAKRPITDVLYREDAGKIRHNKTRKARQPQKKGETVKSIAPTRDAAEKPAPYGTRLAPRNKYEILGL